MGQASLGASDAFAFVAPPPATLLGPSAAALKGGDAGPSAVFVPVVPPGGRGAGGRLLRHASPSLLLHPGGSGCFALPAFGRPLTELDFISPGERCD